MTALLLIALLRAAAAADDHVWLERRDQVRAALRDSFRAWERLAGGADDLAPVSERGLDWLGCRATLFDSLDALYVANLREDYDRAVASVFSGRWGDPFGRGAPT